MANQNRTPWDNSGGTNANAREFKTARLGVNIRKNMTQLDEEECFLSANLIWRNGMVKRGGSSKYAATEVSAGKAITGIHRFYTSTTKYLLVSAGTGIYYLNGGAWTQIANAQTDGVATYFHTWRDVVYISNGVDAPKKWDGAAFSTVTAAPATTLAFISYQDRLLSIIADGTLTWSASWSDASWETPAGTGVKVDSRVYGMGYYSTYEINSGYKTSILVAGANGMWLFNGTDLRTPSTTGNYTLYRVYPIGCSSPKTIQWTPAGTIWWGSDKQVYMLPYVSNSYTAANASATPIPIGDKIRASQPGMVGVEVGNSVGACAAYHDGFYMLSFTSSGSNHNATQFWLDVNRLKQDSETGSYGPWYGPMEGTTISCFSAFTGQDDSGELVGGESLGTNGSFVRQLNQKTVYADSGTAFTTTYKTPLNPLGDQPFEKDVYKYEIDLLNTISTVSVVFSDLAGTKGTYSLSLPGTAPYWGAAYWGVNYWGSYSPVRQVLNLAPPIRTRSLAVTVIHTNAGVGFEIYGQRVMAVEQSEEFAA